MRQAKCSKVAELQDTAPTNPVKQDERLKTAWDIRTALKERYPDVDDDDFALAHSGHVHENPMTAIGVVLISSLVLGTTDVDLLCEFTKYSRRFIEAIARNTENSGLWKGGKYDCGRWSSGNLLPRSQHEDDEFWNHIEVAAGSSFTKDSKSFEAEHADVIFWNEKNVN